MFHQKFMFWMETEASRIDFALYANAPWKFQFLSTFFIQAKDFYSCVVAPCCYLISCITSRIWNINKCFHNKSNGPNLLLSKRHARRKGSFRRVDRSINLRLFSSHCNIFASVFERNEHSFAGYSQKRGSHPADASILLFPDSKPSAYNFISGNQTIQILNMKDVFESLQ